jgi:signal transduction histidine kinase
MCIKLVINRYSLALLCFWVILCPLKTTAQQNYIFERLNSENGLPTNAIKGLQFDAKNRFLWIATESGIVRYNGHGFQDFGNIASNEKLNDRIVFFEKANNGTLFGKLIDESVFKIQDNRAVIDTAVSKISWQYEFLKYKYDLKNTVFKGGKNLLNYYDFKINQYIYFITDDRLQVIRNNTIDTLVNLKIKTQGFLLDKNFYLLENDGVIKLVKSLSNGDVELSNFSNLYSSLKSNQNTSTVKIFQNNPNEEVYVLIGTNLYILNFDKQKVILSLITDELPKFEFIRQIQVDELTNTIYLGTDNRGVIVARPRYFRRVLPNNLTEGISTSAYAQFQLSNGNVQINTGQVYGNSKIPSKLVFENPSETNVLKTRDNRLFYTNTNGIVEYDLNKNKIVSFTKEPFSNRNGFVEVNQVIFGINEFGVIKKEPNTSWKLILKFRTAPFNFIVYQLASIGNNQILAATTDGLYKFNISTNEFKRIFKDKTNSNFRSIYNLGGYYLLGTYGGGIYMYKSDTIKQLPLDQNQYLKYAHCFIEDNQNRIWASTNKGLFMAPKQSLIDFWNIGPGKIVYKYFGKLEGIDILEMNGGCEPCAIQLKNGDFSFPGIDGLIQFNPKAIQDLQVRPKVYLDQVIINEKPVQFNELTNLNPNSQKIIFQLGISGMLTQENIRFEYKIDDQLTWNPILIKNAIITLDKPGYGYHTLTVRVRSTYSSNWENKEYQFYINYPWYLYPWMYLLYFLLGIGVVYLFILFKTLIYKRRQKLLETEVAIKTNSLNKMNRFLEKRNQAKDHVIAIMNHDILTPLKYLHITAKNTADQINDQKIKQSVTQIAKTSKELEYLTSNMLNWVKFDNTESLPKPQLIDLYQLVQDLIEFVIPFKEFPKVEILNELPTDTMIQCWPDSLRVLLYNILINGVKSTNEGYVKVQFDQYADHFTIQVIDSGEGMSASMVQYLLTGTSKDEVELLPKYKKGNGIGYQIIRHLVKLMKANLFIDSKEGIGTSIKIIFYHKKLK